ncbi:MAG TPA: hypothetical protein VGF99_12960 [Myxococcota bacterium]
MRSLLLAVVLIVVAVVAGSGCKRSCQSNANCVRTCPCLNELTNQRLDCSVGYRCEGDTQTCEDLLETQTCDEMCQQFAANARCGVNRCLSDAECLRNISCPLFDADGVETGQFRTCTLPFVCDQEFGACEVASSASDSELCSTICAQAAGG